MNKKNKATVMVMGRKRYSFGKIDENDNLFLYLVDIKPNKTTWNLNKKIKLTVFDFFGESKFWSSRVMIIRMRNLFIQQANPTDEVVIFFLYLKNKPKKKKKKKIWNLNKKIKPWFLTFYLINFWSKRVMQYQATD